MLLSIIRRASYSSEIDIINFAAKTLLPLVLAKETSPHKKDDYYEVLKEFVNSQSSSAIKLLVSTEFTRDLVNDIKTKTVQSVMTQLDLLSIIIRGTRCWKQD